MRRSAPLLRCDFREIFHYIVRDQSFTGGEKAKIREMASAITQCVMV